MAICRMCHKIIPDGRDYCDECEHKQKDQADESYLDSLLSSVSLEPGRDDVPVHSDISEAARLSAVRELQAEADSAAEIIASYDVPDDTEVVDTLIIDNSSVTPSAEEDLMNLGENTTGVLIGEDTNEDIVEDIAEDITEDDIIPLDTDEIIPMEEQVPDDFIPSEEELSDDIIPLEPDQPDTIFEELQDDDTDQQDDGFITLDVTGTEDRSGNDDFDIGSIDFDDDTDITKELLNDIITEYEEQHNPERAASAAQQVTEPETVFEAEPAVAAAPEPVFEDEPTVDLEAEPEFETEPASDFEAEPESEAEPADEPEAEPEFIADTSDETDSEPEAEASEESGGEALEEPDQGFNEDDIAPVIDDSLFSLDDEEGTGIDITDEDITDIAEEDITAADITDEEAAAEDTAGEDTADEDISDEGIADEDITATELTDETPGEDTDTEGSSAADDIDSLLSDITGGEIDESDLISIGDDEDAPATTDIDELLTDITDGDVAEAEPLADDQTSDGNVIDDLLTDITSGGDLGDISLGVDDLFTDAASVDSSIDNLDLGETDISQIMDDIESGEFEKEIDKLMPTAEAPEKPPKSMFDRLFGNIVEDLTPEQLEERRAKEEAEEQQRQAAIEAKKKRAAESKEEKAKRKEEEKRAKEEAKKAQAEIKKQQKAEAKEKARQRKELLLAEEAAHPDEGRINRLGASILVVLLGAIAVTIILGTSLFTYRLNIKHAQKNFDMQHYDDAYYDVYGLKIRDKDIELYDRIMTVMYVNAQFNAYNNYMTINERELALNALLKGLQRYDKYYQLATILDIRSDYQYVRNLILVELANQFDLTEEEAYNMIDIEEPLDYTETIYELLGSYEVEQ